jgi:hypothetical protein
MIVKLLLTALLIVCVFWGFRWLNQASPAERKRALLQLAIATLIVLVLIGCFTGRVPLVAGLLALLAPLARWGWRFGLPLAKLWYSRSGGQASFRSHHIVLAVDVRNGRMTGKVTQGPWAGRDLSSLPESELDALRDWLRHRDTKAYYLLSTYLKARGFIPDNEPEADNHAIRDTRDGLEREEALAILGLKDPLSRDALIQAHRRLMSKLHPDKGGSDYLAARVNLARDLLLRELG